ncbi:MAG: flagellar basal body-associated FliL family protein [Candidatus Zixiibacteriota bacterium]
MPDNDKTIVEGGKGQAEAPPPAKKKGGLMLFGGIGLGAVIVGVALALFVVKPMMSDSGGDSAAVEQSESSHEKDAKKPHKKSGEAGEALIHEINNIVINPAGTGGSRFLSVSFGFDLASPALAAQFERREPIIRDALITILSSKTVQQLTDPKEKEIVRYQIKKRLCQLMESDGITGVYYTDFVMQ